MTRRAPWPLPLLLTAGAVAGLVGAVAPWIPHRAAGLNVGGFNLFESTKFFPAVRSGEVSLVREAFLLPLLASAVLLALVAALPEVRARWPRWLCPGVALIACLGALPPYPAVLSAHRDPEYRGQLLLALGALFLILASPLARRLPNRVLMGLCSGLAALGLVFPLLQFARVRPLYAQLYGEPVGVGWGLVVCALGLALEFLSALGRLLTQSTDS